MIEKRSKALEALKRLDEEFVEDILEASDQEILAESQNRHDDPAEYASVMRARFKQAVLRANKGRLLAARAAVNAAASEHQTGKPLDMADARRKLRGILTSGAAAGQLMMAARNENELSDADILTMIGDLRELGLWRDEKEDS